MRTSWFAFPPFVLVSALWFSQAPSTQQGWVPGWLHFYDGMANSPGFCVVEVEPRVVQFRVECNQPGWETIIWQGLPRAGDYIDTLGANWVKVQAFYSFPPGEHQLVGFGVHLRHAEYPPGTPRDDQLRKTNTIRVQNPEWDFTFRNQNRNFCQPGQPAAAAGYQVNGPWGGPRFNRSQCKAAAGNWTWFNGGQTELTEDGKATGYDSGHKEVNSGTWKCVDPARVTIEIAWAKGGWRDTLTLRSDGMRLEGKNQQNGKIWGDRTQPRQLSECQAAAGSWKWFDGGTAVLSAGGDAVGKDKGGKEVNSGKWRCVGIAPVSIEISWVKGNWRDTLSLSADGKRLEGKNQQNSRVWGERIR